MKNKNKIYLCDLLGYIKDHADDLKRKSQSAESIIHYSENIINCAESIEEILFEEGINIRKQIEENNETEINK